MWVLSLFVVVTKLMKTFIMYLFRKGNANECPKGVL